MELWLVVETAGGDRRELAVTVEAKQSVNDLSAAIADRLGRPAAEVAAAEQWCLFNHRLGAAHDGADTVEASGVRFGDHLTFAPPGWRPPDTQQPRTGGAILHLAVIGGPGTGRRVALGAGDHVVGRSPDADVVVDDPALSRRHFRVTVRNDGVTVTDHGSSNGTFIGGQPTEQPVELGIGSVIEAGHSLFRVESYEPSVSTAATGPDGFVRFNRPPRYHPQPVERRFRLPAPPVAPERRRIPMASALGPLLVGIPMIIVALTLNSGTGQRMLVAMSVVTIITAPVLAFVSYWDDRRGGAGRFRRERERFDTQLAQVTEQLSASIIDEEHERRRASPDAADLVERAVRLRSNLWERRPDDHDFLRVSVGWADQSAASHVDVDEGGDDQARADVVADLVRRSTVHNVPAVVELASAGVLGVCGDPPAVADLARWIAVQLAVLHSPRDLVIGAALAGDDVDDWSWLPWLPHARGDSSGREIEWWAVDDREAARLFDSVSALVRERLDERSQRHANDPAPIPAVVLFVSEAVRVERATLTGLLEDGPLVAVHVIWLGRQADDLPGEAGAVVDAADHPATVTLTLPELDQVVGPGVLDRLERDTAERVARALSGVKDVTIGGARGQIPRRVSLPEVLGLTDPDAAQILSRWRERPLGIDAPVGVGPVGTFELDMRADGPHALVGGTTGAGKSELLQTFVVALAATHPPDHLTFLLIDYKGGAAFKDTVHLPHTVGFVTDLDGRLVHRALVSLDAELRRREHVLRDHDVKDIIEMERRFPEAAPPALLLLVDEFAALAKEFPDFVDGVVNIAQRGRSLGIHLILATQRPAGAINDNVRANTNLRLALRMNDVSDSQDVIDARDAALLPRSLPGRAFARMGQSDLTEFQVAFAGGRSLADHRSEPTMATAAEVRRGRVVAPGDDGAVTNGSAVTVMLPVTDEVPTDLEVLVALINEANTMASIPPQRTPWLPALPPIVTLDDLPWDRSAGSDALVPLGLVDVPRAQRQDTFVLDLEADGSALVIGTTGSGKTTLLRTIAVALARDHRADAVHIQCIDAAGRGLAPLEDLPHVGSVVPGDDIERIQRLVVRLEGELARRQDLFAERRVSTLTEHRALGHEQLPRIVVMLDGYAGFAAMFERIDYGQWIDRVTRLIADGRAFGIHWIVTADRRGALSMALMSALGTRIVLRMAEPDDYGAMGLDPVATRGAALPPGRGFTAASLEVQTAVVSRDASGQAQAEALADLAGSLPAVADGDLPEPVLSMPAGLSLAGLPGAAAAGRAVIGIDETELAPATVSLDDGNLLVAGPPRSGKSTALQTLVTGLLASTPGLRAVLLAPRRTPLTDLDVWDEVAAGYDACDAIGATLERQMNEPRGEFGLLVVVDDAVELADSAADIALELVARRGREHGVSVIAAAESSMARRAYGGVVAAVRRERHGLLLVPDPDLDGDLLNVTIARRPRGFWVPGRGVLVANGHDRVVHVASSDFTATAL